MPLTKVHNLRCRSNSVLNVDQIVPSQMASGQKKLSMFDEQKKYNAFYSWRTFRMHNFYNYSIIFTDNETMKKTSEIWIWSKAEEWSWKQVINSMPQRGTLPLMDTFERDYFFVFIRRRFFTCFLIKTSSRHTRLRPTLVVIQGGSHQQKAEIHNGIYGGLCF